MKDEIKIFHVSKYKLKVIKGVQSALLRNVTIFLLTSISMQVEIEVTRQRYQHLGIILCKKIDLKTS